MQQKTSSNGFAPVAVLLVILVIAVLTFGGWYVWHKHHATKPTGQTSRQTNTQQLSQQNQTPADPYAGWKTTCDDELKACYKYPTDWVASKYTGWQNATDTAYFNFTADNKDQAASSVYIATIDDLANANQGLKIVGTIDNNVPSYTVYDASVVSDKHLVVGEIAQLVTVNPTFASRGADKDITFAATPGATGIAAITAINQAKAWFNTPEAKECLKILQSFYYQ